MVWIEQFEPANWGQASCIALGAYLLGCFSTGFYLVRARTGQDIRSLGSGNAGARNVGRFLGWSGFAITMLGDFGKGALAVWAAQLFTQDSRWVALALLGVVAGHVWPAQLFFHGGKGVATSLGALLVFEPHLALAFCVLFGCGLALMRKTVLPCLFAFGCLPLVSKYLGYTPTQTGCLWCLGLVILFAHRKNLLEEFSRLLERRHLAPKQHPPEL